jgi:glycosyltransferase involved in cell wall biosynthesis
MATLRVSVVVPTHNAAAWLAETLDSVLAQAWPDTEVIVVDDASTDATVALVSQSFPQVRLIQQARGGVCRARNRGLQQATGALVCFLDQDDVWHPQQLAQQAAFLQAHAEVAAVATPYQFWFPTQGQQRPAILGTGPARPVPGFEGYTYHQFLLDCWALTSATMLRTEVVRELGGFDETMSYAEDWDLWLRLARQHRFVQLDWPPVLYRQHTQQGSRRVRPIDHRSDLLQGTAARHGLLSPDGQGISPARFRRQLARYRFEFGYLHLQQGQRSVAVRALLQAWWQWPRQVRALALAVLGTVGWRPRAVSTANPGSPAVIH